MIPPLQRPKRKNPILRTRQPVLPPTPRSRAALGLTAAAALGRFELQVCAACGTVQYPPREMCRECLGEKLRWRAQDGAGELLSVTAVHVSQDVYFRERAPWHVGMVRLDCGPTVIAHLHAACPEPPSRVRIDARLDKAGRGVLVAFPTNEVPNMADDRQLREFTCDPKFRKVLVTDGKTKVGQALVRALVAAGADLVWVGQAEPWKRSTGLDALSTLPQVAVVPLDVTDSNAVSQLAGEIGGRVDILINNAEFHRSQGASSGAGVEFARAEMDVNYFGLLRLAQAFGPALKGRAADGEFSAVAWVNLLSVFALSNFPAHGTFSASKAASLSLSQCLRAEMQPAGLRVINVFPGPIDDEWNQTLPPPKLSDDALARAVVAALRDGVEDVYPGDVAQEWLERWRENPKILERELAQ
jgi:NAD(P)-dependent dehydrogenase (short-subunit alcohol dehydrogenase family)/uncharacterized OB-fold protein